MKTECIEKCINVADEYSHPTNMDRSSKARAELRELKRLAEIGEKYTNLPTAHILQERQTIALERIADAISKPGDRK